MKPLKLKNYYSEEQPELNMKQSRSKKTYDALISAGFKLLKKQEYDSITVAEVSKLAGYSVGAFYGRFQSKDELFYAMVNHHFTIRYKKLERLFSTLYDKNFVDELIKDIVKYYWTNRSFWRAALARRMYDSEFWAPVKMSGDSITVSFITRLSELTNRPLTDTEEENIHFGFQLMGGIINNMVVNEPGPVPMKQKVFVEKLTRAFRLVTDYDNILKVK